MIQEDWYEKKTCKRIDGSACGIMQRFQKRLRYSRRLIALEKAQEKFDQSRYRHRAVLIYDKNDNIIGKVSQLDVLRALEPKYEAMGIPGSLSRFGLTKRFQETHAQ